MIAVTFLLSLPLRQVIVVFPTAFGLGSGLGDDVTTPADVSLEVGEDLGDSWESFT